MLILNYHHVGEPPKSARYKGMYVTEDHLRWQIRLLKFANYSFVTVSAGVSLGLGPKLAAITFDDGYTDNLTLGLDVLRSEGVPATVYVVTSDVGKKGHVWQEAGDKAACDLLDWDQLKVLKQSGWEIGSHSSEHVHHARRNPQEQKALIVESQQALQANLGLLPKSFAYPYGSYTEQTVPILRELGFVSAVTTKSDGQNNNQTDSLQLFRRPGKGYNLSHYIRAISLLRTS
jgi:peptidoglycan/xylan/chitin deacetylase (PgdA/CDA1 family)